MQGKNEGKLPDFGRECRGGFELPQIQSGKPKNQEPFRLACLFAASLSGSN